MHRSSTGIEEDEGEIQERGSPPGDDMRLQPHGRKWKLKASLGVNHLWPQHVLPGAKQPSQYLLRLFACSQHNIKPMQLFLQSLEQAIRVLYLLENSYDGLVFAWLWL